MSDEPGPGHPGGSPLRSFEAPIQAGRGGGAFVLIPFDIKAAFGSGRPRVRALVDRHEYRGSLMNMGQGHCLGIRKDVRAAIGKDIGDVVRIQVELDTEPRVVAVPDELSTALDAAPDAAARYAKLSYTHRREFAEWVAEAKRQETRDRRAAKAVEMILEGRTR